LKRTVIYLFAILALYSCNAQPKLESHKEVLKLMGTRFELTATADSKEIAQQGVHNGIAEIQRIESLISSWQSTSQTSEINRNAGVKAIIVEKELYDLIDRSIKVSGLTQGAFDISFAGMERIYEFDKGEHELPDAKTLLESIAKIDYQNIILNKEDGSVFLKEKGMRIGFGGIGKGYAANRAKQVMMAMDGVKGGVVNASGDLVVWGDNGSAESWKIQISDPKDINKSLGTIGIKNASVVTSGDYEKYFTHHDKRYAHIIDPSTGIPTSGVKSATVVCPDAELGDALATSIFVLGPTEGIALINRLKNTEALIITDEDIILTSNNLEFNP
jgi:thiamine biosynthesis lipoprotein